MDSTDIWEFDAFYNSQYEHDLCTVMTLDDCLQRIDTNDDYDKYRGALACLFAIDHKVVGRFANLDMFRFEYTLDYPYDKSVNYIQRVHHNETIESLLLYIFNDSDYMGKNDIEYRDCDLERITEYGLRIIETFSVDDQQLDYHEVAEKYLDWLYDRLWLPNDSTFITLIARNLEKLVKNGKY